jgi:chemotaxis protein CheC
MKAIDDLNSSELEILKEIGNIGAGNAITSLAKMISKRVDMEVPVTRILDFREIPSILGREDDIIVGILLPIVGDLRGFIMFVLNQSSAHSLVNILLGKQEIENSEDFSDIEISALKEVGNILVSSYISALSSLTNLRIVPQVPDISIDMAGAILSVPAINYGTVGDKVLYIETQFDDGTEKVVGEFFLISDVDSYGTLLRALGVTI